MGTKNTAAPTPGADPVGFCETTPGMKMNWLGMTKREKFAESAMSAITAANWDSDVSYEDVAKYAVLQADALIKALND